jgi:uncharacterized protein (DUF433 family)
MSEALLMTSQHDCITTDPLRRGGRPCVRDLRISVGDVLGRLAMGQTAEQIVADHPELTLADVDIWAAQQRSNIDVICASSVA